MTDDTHIGTDPERLEQFVMGRLPGEELRRIDEHIRSCPECAAAVRTERELAAGVRRFARQEMKSRLARRLGTTAPVGIPWQHIVAAAAAVAIVVGIGWYSNWFGMPGREPAPTLGEISEQKGVAGSKKATGPPDERLRAPETESQFAPDTMIDEMEGTGLSAQGKPPVAGRDANEAKAEFRSRRTDSVAGRKEGEDRGAPAPVEAAAKSVAAPHGAQQLWTAGIILGEPVSAAAEEQGGKDKSDLALRESDRSQPRTQGNVVRQKRAMVESTPVILIDQRPLSSLPPARQTLQMQSDFRQVQTLVDHRGDTLRVVLYLERLLDANAIQSATAEQVGEDSLIIRIQEQAIGLRVPFLQSRRTK